MKNLLYFFRRFLLEGGSSWIRVSESLSTRLPIETLAPSLATEDSAGVVRDRISASGRH